MLLKKINNLIKNNNSGAQVLTTEQLKEKRMEYIRSNVPFIAIILVVLLFTMISGTRFFSVRNLSFIA